MPVYTVIGIYGDPLGQRFSTTVEADSPQEAEITVHRGAYSGVIIAGVFAGHVKPVDMYTDGLAGVPRP